MDTNDENPYVPHFITYKDVARIENKTLDGAKGVTKRMRKKYGIPREFPILTDLYCDHRGTNQPAIAKFFTKRFLPVWIVIATALTLVCCRVIIKNYFPELNNFINWHFIFWESASSTHAHGHYFVKDPATGKEEKLIIDVKRINRDQIPDFVKHFYDTVQPKNALYPLKH